MSTTDRQVNISENGRSGGVHYRDPNGELSFHWEFGGGTTLAIVQCGDARSWEKYSWAIADRAEILRFIATEMVRQKAPSCRAEINEVTGDIVLCQVSAPPPPPAGPNVAFVRRLSGLKVVLGVTVLALALIFGGVMWFKNKVLVIDPGQGTPLGLSVRTDQHIATLIQTLVPYTPSLNRDHGKDRYRLSIFIVPLDGSDTHLVDLPEEALPSAFSLAKILGSDGRTLWFDVGGIRGMDLKTFELLSPAEVRDPYVPGQNNALPFGPKVEHHLAAGLFTGPDEWLGVHSTMEAERDFEPKSWLKRVVRAENAKEMRNFHRGTLDPDTSDGHHRVLSMLPMGEEEYLNAAFLRMDDTSEPLRLRDPDGALMIYTSEPGLRGTLVVTRVGTTGNIIWKVDTGIDRFNLQQILPGERSMAFVGRRLPVPEKVSEPLLVIVENVTGNMTVHSLWR